MGTYLHAKPIVTDGLIFSLDSFNSKSYISGGTTTDDLTINENNGTLNNGIGFDGQGWILDGISDYINMDNNFNFGTDNFTLDFWLWKTGRQYSYVMDVGVNKAAFTIGPGTGDSIGAGSSVQVYGGSFIFFLGTELGTDWYPIQEWFNLSVVRDTAESRLYLNGDLMFTYNSPSGNFGSATPSDDFVVGAAGGPVILVQGGLSTSKIYNKALTSAEIMQNYEALKHRYNE